MQVQLHDRKVAVTIAIVVVVAVGIVVQALIARSHGRSTAHQAQAAVQRWLDAHGSGRETVTGCQIVDDTPQAFYFDCAISGRCPQKWTFSMPLENGSIGDVAAPVGTARPARC